jgi:hypothetical protein
VHNLSRHIYRLWRGLTWNTPRPVWPSVPYRLLPPPGLVPALPGTLLQQHNITQHHLTCLSCVVGCAGILEQSMGARNQVGIGLSYRPARLHRLAESIPWNRYLGSLNIYKFGLWRATVRRTWFVGCGGTAVAPDGVVVLLLSTVGQVQLKRHLQLSSSNDVYERDCLLILSSWAAASPQRPMDWPQYTSVNRSRMYVLRLSRNSTGCHMWINTKNANLIFHRESWLLPVKTLSRKK